MIPVSVICNTCGEYSGKTKWMESNYTQEPEGEHEDIKECVRNLSFRLKLLEKKQGLERHSYIGEERDTK